MDAEGLRAFSFQIVGHTKAMTLQNVDVTQSNLSTTRKTATITFRASATRAGARQIVGSTITDEKGEQSLPWFLKIFGLSHSTTSLSVDNFGLKEKQHFKFQYSGGRSKIVGGKIVKIDTLHVEWYSTVTFGITPSVFGVDGHTYNIKLSTHIVAVKIYEVTFEACPNSSKVSVTATPAK